MSASPSHYVNIEGKTYGPYTTAQLAELAWKGTITPETPWCVAGAGTWATAAAAPGITFQPRAALPERGSRLLANCPGCGNQVSTEAVACPKCGHQFKAPGGFSMKDPVHAGCVIVVLGFLVLAAFLLMHG